MQPIQQKEYQKERTQNVKYHFDSIDILRGFAAISVVVYHIIEHFNWSSFPTNWPWLWFRFGWMGVVLLLRCQPSTNWIEVGKINFLSLL